MILKTMKKFYLNYMKIFLQKNYLYIIFNAIIALSFSYIDLHFNRIYVTKSIVSIAKINNKPIASTDVIFEKINNLTGSNDLVNEIEYVNFLKSQKVSRTRTDIIFTYVSVTPDFPEKKLSLYTDKIVNYLNKEYEIYFPSKSFIGELNKLPKLNNNIVFNITPQLLIEEPIEYFKLSSFSSTSQVKNFNRIFIIFFISFLILNLITYLIKCYLKK
jgi:hypothetical protein